MRTRALARSAFLLVALMVCAAAAPAQQTWEGNAAVSRYGVFPSSGLYGAANSFPQNTLVTVTNEANGKQASVLIIDRVTDNGLLVQLSADAGTALGIDVGSSVKVQVTLAQQPSSNGIASESPYSPDSDVYPAAGAGPQSLDFLSQYQQTQPAQSPQPAQAAQQTPSTPAASTAPPVATSPKVAELSPTVAPQQAQPGTSGLPSATTSASPAIAELNPATAPASTQPPQATTPQPQPAPGPEVAELTPLSAPGAGADGTATTPVPPAQSGPLVAELSPPQAPNPEGGELAAAALPGPAVSMPTASVAGLPDVAAPQGSPTPQVAEVTPVAPGASPAGPEADLAEVEPPAAAGLLATTTTPPLPTQSASEPNIGGLIEPAPGASPAVAAILPAPAAAQSAPKVAQQPTPAATGQPPAAQTQQTQVATVQPTTPQPVSQPTPAPAATTLPTGVQSEASMTVNSYYVQLGTFRESSSALNLAGTLSPVYPVAVVAATSRDKQVYKVLVGPLRQDEGGALLYAFIARGYHDAFLRKAN